MSDALDYPPQLARYSRQVLLPQIGLDGQRRLAKASATLIGCGALGSVLAGTLVRAGLGALRIIDRDFIEPNNLHRHALFDEHDIAQNLPKAEAAVRKLRRINSAVEIEGLVADVNPGNIEALCGTADLLLDGTDNLETRYLINDLAVKHDLPWVFGACLGTEGLVLPILPHRTACLRCIWEEPPGPGTLPTCDTAGVLATAAQIVASLQATEALKILLGRDAEVNRHLLAIDAWTGRVRRIDVQSGFGQRSCVCCKHGRYEFLAGQKATVTTSLCGRDAVQIMPSAGTVVDFRTIAGRLPGSAHPRANEFLLKFSVEHYTVTLFADGRAIVQGTSDPAVARSVYAKYIGT